MVQPSAANSHQDRDVSTMPASHDAKSLCHKYMHYHIIAQTHDGQQFDGIIVGISDDGITILVAEDAEGSDRAYDGSYRPIGFGPRFRRFRPRLFPFSFFGFPFFRPFPYIYPYPLYPGFGGGIW